MPTKLNATQVLEIVSAYLDGERCMDIARRYNVTSHTVTDILHGHTWSQVTGRSGWPTLEEKLSRYTQRGDPDDCWIWVGPYDDKGRPVLKHKDAKLRPHRVAYELLHGHPVPSDVWIVRICHNLRCVNPRHCIQHPVGRQGKSNRSQAPATSEDAISNADITKRMLMAYDPDKSVSELLDEFTSILGEIFPAAYAKPRAKEVLAMCVSHNFVDGYLDDLVSNHVARWASRLHISNTLNP